MQFVAIRPLLNPFKPNPSSIYIIISRSSISILTSMTALYQGTLRHKYNSSTESHRQSRDTKRSSQPIPRCSRAYSTGSIRGRRKSSRTSSTQCQVRLMMNEENHRHSCYASKRSKNLSLSDITSGCGTRIRSRRAIFPARFRSCGIRIRCLNRAHVVMYPCVSLTARGWLFRKHGIASTTIICCHRAKWFGSVYNSYRRRYETYLGQHIARVWLGSSALTSAVCGKYRSVLPVLREGFAIPERLIELWASRVAAPTVAQPEGQCRPGE